MSKILTITFVVTVTFFIFCFDLNSMVFGNDGERGYEGGDDSGNSPLLIENNQIKVLIVQGAVQFLKSQSKFQDFLQKLEQSELSRVNFEELQGVLNSTIYITECARNTYLDLKILAGCTPYNETFINKLKIFDYDVFQYENNLNPAIFNQVKTLLSVGDLTGIYIEIHSRIVNILNRLYFLKSVIDRYVIPERLEYWIINNNFLQLELFGQYSSQVFHNIKLE